MSVLSLILLLCPFYLSASINWHTNYAHAITSSHQEKKPILLFFHGSDWSVNAMKMKHEILDQSDFQDKIEEHFICMEADFPKHMNVQQTLLEQNNQLKQRFHVSTFPTLVMIDGDERVITQISYLPSDPAQFAAELLNIVEKDGELLTALDEMNRTKLSQERLKEMYYMAQELGSGLSIEKILQNGIERSDLFCIVEKYRLLVQNGERTSAESQQLRDLLTSRDQAELVDGQYLGFTLALIDFQYFSQNGNAPDVSSKPLKDYLVTFASRDRRNAWRVEMMIAELYLDYDDWETALHHAQNALNDAPENARAEVVHSLDYIRSKQSSI